jgi:transcriptional regulator with XRE-family HTH domain
MDKEWFKAILKTKHLSQRGLAKQLGLDPAAVSLMFQGERRMRMEEAAAISRLLGVGLQEVHRRAGIAVQEDVSRLRVIFSTDSTSRVMALAAEAIFDFLAPAGCPAGSYGIQVRDPRDLRDHSIYVVSSDPNPNFSGRSLLAHVVSSNGEPYLGYICKGYAPNAHQLYAIDGRVLVEDFSAQVIRPVLWVSPLGLF